MAARPPGNRRRTRGGARALAIVLVPCVVVGAAAGAYVAARQTGIFALRKIEVEGAPPPVAASVRQTLGPFVGRSLVRFDAAQAARRLSAVSEVAGATFDRAFPHTLKVHVRTERPVAVIRQGSAAWLVSASARVLGSLERPYPRLPRIWLPRSADITVNTTLGGAGAQGVAALAPLVQLPLPAEVRQVVTGDRKGLTLVLASGTELRLGDSGDLRLKFAIARRLLPVTVGARYVDVSVPERPVAGFNSKVAG